MKTTTQSPRTSSKAHAAQTRALPKSLATPASRKAESSMTKQEAIDALKEVNKTMNKTIRAAAASPASVPSTNFVSELNNLDFQKYIGGPLQACVSAQVASSVASVDFINSIGFQETADGKKELVMVDFTHDKKDVDATGAEVSTTRHIRVPLIAMVQIPSLRIEYVEINFNVKLNSVETQTTSSQLGVNAAISGGWGPVKFKVSASYQRSTATGIKVEKEYALNVKCRAVQDEMPAGLQQIMNLLAA